MINLRTLVYFVWITGIEFGQTIYRIGPWYPFLFKPEEIKGCLNQSLYPPIDETIVEKWEVTRDNIYEIIEDWNVRYFPTEAAAQQALKEYKDIIVIEDEGTRYNEYDNWFAERSSWMVG